MAHPVQFTAQVGLLGAFLKFADPISADRRQLREKNSDLLFYLSSVAHGGNPYVSFGIWVAPDTPKFVPGAVYGASQTRLLTRYEGDEIMPELTIDGLDELRREVIITPLTTQDGKKMRRVLLTKY